MLYPGGIIFQKVSLSSGNNSMLLLCHFPFKNDLMLYHWGYLLMDFLDIWTMVHAMDEELLVLNLMMVPTGTNLPWGTWGWACWGGRSAGTSSAGGGSVTTSAGGGSANMGGTILGIGDEDLLSSTAFGSAIFQHGGSGREVRLPPISSSSFLASMLWKVWNVPGSAWIWIRGNILK